MSTSSRKPRPTSPSSPSLDVRPELFLDILTKEEKEVLLSKKMEEMRRKNEALQKRHAEIEADKKAAEKRGQAVQMKASSPPPAHISTHKPSNNISSAPHRPTNNISSAPHRPTNNISNAPHRPTNNPSSAPHKPTNNSSSAHHDMKGVSSAPREESQGPSKYSVGRGKRLAHMSQQKLKAQIVASKESDDNTKPANMMSPQPKHVDEPPPDPTYNFLSDRSRQGPVEGQPKQTQRPSNAEEAARRHPRNFGGSSFDGVKTKLKAEQEKNQFPGPARTKMELEMQMTGRERREYSQWKKERDEIDKQRIERQQNSQGDWTREWDVKKSDMPNLPEPPVSRRQEPGRRPAGRIGSGRFVTTTEERAKEAASASRGGGTGHGVKVGSGRAPLSPTQQEPGSQSRVRISSQGSDDGLRYVEEQNDNLVVKIENDFAGNKRPNMRESNRETYRQNSGEDDRVTGPASRGNRGGAGGGRGRGGAASGGRRGGVSRGGGGFRKDRDAPLAPGTTATIVTGPGKPVLKRNPPGGAGGGGDGGSGGDRRSMGSHLGGPGQGRFGTPQGQKTVTFPTNPVAGVSPNADWRPPLVSQPNWNTNSPSDPIMGGPQPGMHIVPVPFVPPGVWVPPHSVPPPALQAASNQWENKKLSEEVWKEVDKIPEFKPRVSESSTPTTTTVETIINKVNDSNKTPSTIEDAKTNSHKEQEQNLDKDANGEHEFIGDDENEGDYDDDEYEDIEVEETVGDYVEDEEEIKSSVVQPQPPPETTSPRVLEFEEGEHDSSADSLDRFIQANTLRLDMDAAGNVSLETGGEVEMMTGSQTPSTPGSFYMKTPEGHVKVFDWAAEMEGSPTYVDSKNSDASDSLGNISLDISDCDGGASPQKLTYEEETIVDDVSSKGTESATQLSETDNTGTETCCEEEASSCPTAEDHEEETVDIMPLGAEEVHSDSTVTAEVEAETAQETTDVDVDEITPEVDAATEDVGMKAASAEVSQTDVDVDEATPEVDAATEDVGMKAASAEVSQTDVDVDEATPQVDAATEDVGMKTACEEVSQTEPCLTGEPLVNTNEQSLTDEPLVTTTDTTNAETATVEPIVKDAPDACTENMDTHSESVTVANEVPHTDASSEDIEVKDSRPESADSASECVQDEMTSCEAEESEKTDVSPGEDKKESDLGLSEKKDYIPVCSDAPSDNKEVLASKCDASEETDETQDLASSV